MKSNKIMEKVMKNVSILSVVSFLSVLSTGVFAADSARIRVDTRQGLFGGKLATKVEAVGEPDGSAIAVWDTAKRQYGQRVYPDGWYVRKDAGGGLLAWQPLDETETPDHDVLVLNEHTVLGGRMTTNEVWTTGVVHVVRHNVVIPSGTTLTVDPEAIVKFTENARLVVEEGGSWIAKGSWFAEFQDDTWVGGDTNLDGTNSVPTGTQDWISGMDPANYVHVMMLDGSVQVFPTRTYTRGEVYGILPTMDRYDEGFHFRGWVTNLEETVGVEVEQLADMDQPALYANWEAIYLNVSTGSLEFAAYSVDELREIGVGANDKWICETDADWLHLVAVEDEGNDASRDIHDGTVAVTADQNRSELPRSATIRIMRANGGLLREVNVTQKAMARAEMPELRLGSGQQTFSDYATPVIITCRTKGATIYYTTDDSEPSPENGLKLETGEYEEGIGGIVTIFGSTTVKAVAVRTDLLDSYVSTKRFVRESTLAEAMDIPDNFVSTEGDANWSVVKDETSDGISAVRSGAMKTSMTQRRNSRISTYFEGQGTLTFRWKVSCELDRSSNRGPDEESNWDYLAFLADGRSVKRIDGESGWEEVSYTFKGSGVHVVEWVYSKNEGFDFFSCGQDCGWVDQVKWTPEIYDGEGADARELYVKQGWLVSSGLVGAADDGADIVEKAKADDDGDGYTNEEEILLGTDPQDASSKLQAYIVQEDGVMKVRFDPEVKSDDYDLDYRILSVAELGGDWKDVTDLSDEERQEAGFKFFKIKVRVNKK